MSLTEQEKEELFTEFAVKFAEMDKEAKKLRVAENNSALKGMTRYYQETMQHLKQSGMAYDELGFFRYYGIYQAYLALRQSVIYIVNAKKHERINNLGQLDRDKDVEMATQAGKIMIDAMMSYLLEETKEG